MSVSQVVVSPQVLFEISNHLQYVKSNNIDSKNAESECNNSCCLGVLLGNVLNQDSDQYQVTACFQLPCKTGDKDTIESSEQWRATCQSIIEFHLQHNESLTVLGLYSCPTLSTDSANSNSVYSKLIQELGGIIMNYQKAKVHQPLLLINCQFSSRDGLSLDTNVLSQDGLTMTRNKSTQQSQLDVVVQNTGDYCSNNDIAEKIAIRDLMSSRVDEVELLQSRLDSLRQFHKQVQLHQRSLRNNYNNETNVAGVKDGSTSEDQDSTERALQFVSSIMKAAYNAGHGKDYAPRRQITQCRELLHLLKVFEASTQLNTLIDRELV
ncbi:hypothetical protein MP228_000093 [Amoeboaphelidium protococcarum]|nr:hypothetical protein MP228_000093 [Amoeboaphelidium protococcarum]